MRASRGKQLTRAHLRRRTRPQGGSVLHCLLLDCSASMLQGGRLALAKGLLSQWAKAMYPRRESLVVVGFSGRDARILRLPGKAGRANDDWIRPIEGGGETPIDAALALAERVLRRVDDERALWLLSDARFPALPPRPHGVDQCGVIDFDDGPLRLGRAQALAEAWQATYINAKTLI